MIYYKKMKSLIYNLIISFAIVLLSQFAALNRSHSIAELSSLFMILLKMICNPHIQFPCSCKWRNICTNGVIRKLWRSLILQVPCFHPGTQLQIFYIATTLLWHLITITLLIFERLQIKTSLAVRGLLHYSNHQSFRMECFKTLQLQIKHLPTHIVSLWHLSINLQSCQYYGIWLDFFNEA